MIIYSIYKFVNTINGKIYIGFTNDADRRLIEHKSNYIRIKNKFYNAIRKYGWSCFQFEIIYQSLDGEHCLKQMEPYFIKENNSFKSGYNSTTGGDFNKIDFHPITKKKMSKARNGRFNAKDKDGKIHIINNNDPRFLSGELVGINKGVSPSAETSKKMSTSKIGNQNRLGIPHSDEMKKIISERTSLALKGKPKKTIVCPHCGKVGGAGNMKRYHFDYCKLIPQGTIVKAK